VEHHSRTSNTAIRAGLAFAVCFAVTVFSASSAHSQTYEVLHSFAGGSDGGGPFAGLLTLDPEGNLYGTTEYGGSFTYGTVFRIDKAGNNTVLHPFTGGVDEMKPYGGVIRDNDGNLYGTAAGGYDSGSPFGTVFKLSATGEFTNLYTFRGGKDGAYPTGGLLADGEGNLYGVTDEGGKFGFGTVFEVSKAGKERILYSFQNQPDGQFPLYETLAMDSNRNLYGTTYAGGTFNQGTVFKLDAATRTEEILYSFGGGEDGALPYSGLLLDADGNLYGTTSNGGGAGAGTIFKLSPTGKETLLYKFLGGTDGIFPLGSLLRDASGDFYGTTTYGGANESGTVYRLTGGGQETLLHSFDWAEGMNPYGGLIQDTAGNLYGTTAVGGAIGFGTVFKITP
jgi:uncharacterized repeat protein (TIGR03803 family)